MAHAENATLGWLKIRLLQIVPFAPDMPGPDRYDRKHRLGISILILRFRDRLGSFKIFSQSRFITIKIIQYTHSINLFCADRMWLVIAPPDNYTVFRLHQFKLLLVTTTWIMLYTFRLCCWAVEVFTSLENLEATHPFHPLISCSSRLAQWPVVHYWSSMAQFSSLPL